MPTPGCTCALSAGTEEGRGWGPSRRTRGSAGMPTAHHELLNYSPTGADGLSPAADLARPLPRIPAFCSAPSPFAWSPQSPAHRSLEREGEAHCSEDKAWAGERDVCEGTHFCPGEGPHGDSPPGLLFKQGLEVLRFTNDLYKGHSPVPEPRPSQPLNLTASRPGHSTTGA